MANSDFQCLIFIIVYSDLRKKVTTSNNTNNTPVELHKSGEFGEYIKQLLPTIKQPAETITILANCTIEKDESNPAGIGKSIELFKLIGGELKSLDEFRNANITEFTNLNDLFFKVNSQFSSPRKLIFTYGHGSVFGLFAQTHTPAFIIERINDSKSFTLKSMDFLKGITEIFKPKMSLTKELVGDYFGYENDYITLSDIRNDTNNLLSNEELAEAISESFGSIDILIMNNCLMQNVYAQTAFKDTVNYLIAPQSGITFPGFDLQSIYTSFTPGSTINDISKQIVESFKSSKEPVTKEYLIVAFNLSNYTDIINNMKLLKEYVYEKLQIKDLNYSSNIANSLNDALPFDKSISHGVSMYDIFQWTKKLAAFDTDENLKKIVAGIEAFISQNANPIFIGEAVNVINKDGAIYTYAKNNISGLCVYLPLNNGGKNNILEEVYDRTCAFENIIKWRNVVDLYTIQKPRRMDNIKSKIEFKWTNIPS